MNSTLDNCWDGGSMLLRTEGKDSHCHPPCTQDSSTSEGHPLSGLLSHAVAFVFEKSQALDALRLRMERRAQKPRAVFEAWYIHANMLISNTNYEVPLMRRFT